MLYLIVREEKKTSISCMFSVRNLHLYKSKKEGKDQELIQSSTTPDPGHHKGKTGKVINGQQDLHMEEIKS